jgi:hypothetical protein
MMFFTLGMILVYKKRWLPYYLFFAIATFNRETTCFLTFIYMFTAFGKERNRTIALHCGVQLVIWMAIKYSLYLIYAPNAGQPFQGGVTVNMHIFTMPSYYFFILSNMGFLWIPTLLFWRRVEDDYVKRLLFVIVPFLLGNFLMGSLRNSGALES